MNISYFYVILVEPKYSGNIGAVARIMANFDFENLFLVNPCKINDECYARAMHASKILDDSKIFKSFNEAIKKIDFLVATSSIESKNDKKHLRNAVILEEFSEKIFEIDGNIGLIFGREDYGLLNEEIARCDVMLKIPTSDNYPSLNLSHAVGLILYSLFIKNQISTKKRIISKIEKDKLNSFYKELLDLINYPEHKKQKTEVMFKRIMGRAMPSKWEYHTLMGVLSKSIELIKDKKKQ
ncbi:MAG: RNA methyltransferase [Thermoplasmatales archaeon]|nr:MAG: RNA methyltransferase [Thermoplasmatales archaeon]